MCMSATLRSLLVTAVCADKKLGLQVDVSEIVPLADDHFAQCVLAGG